MSVLSLCRLAGMSRQNFYKARVARSRRAVDEELVLSLVRRERALQFRLGARKLLVRIAPDLLDAGVTVGRDRFLALLRREGLLVECRRGGPRTTCSRHRFRVYPNLLKDAKLTGPHQAWVCDITYIRTEAGFVYLALVMDAWSRKIVGWDLGSCLEASGAARALGMAIRQLPADGKPVHHSDRGTQYCCGEYVGILEGRGLSISMTVENHCYENGKAERLNGILKQEYGLGGTFAGERGALLAAREAVLLYNGRRPHTALGYKTPECAHGLAA